MIMEDVIIIAKSQTRDPDESGLTSEMQRAVLLLFETEKQV